MNGWILLHRSIQKHWLWQKKPFTEGQAWIDMLMMVNHKPEKVIIKGVEYYCDRGESVCCLNTWAERWDWDKSKVRRFFDKLENEGMIKRLPAPQQSAQQTTHKATRKTTHLRVVNYNVYQNPRHSKKTESDTVKDTKQIKLKELKEKKETKLEDSSSTTLDLGLQEKLLKESELYQTMIKRCFTDLLPVEKKTFENIYLYLLKIAKKEKGPTVFIKARTILANKIDYVERNGKTQTDTQKMYVAEIKKQFGFKKRLNYSFDS